MEGKTAIIVGSTAGIGFSIARRLAQDGLRVVVSSRKQENVNRAVESLRSEPGKLVVEGVVCNVAISQHRSALIEKTISRFGGIDFIVINAATNPSYGLLINATESAWDKIMTTNVVSAALLVKEALPYLIEKKGSVVFVSSNSAYGPNIDTGVYGVSKTALLGLTKILSVELAKHKIRVNCLSPGLIKTDFAEVIFSAAKKKSEAMSIIPMKRAGHPDECAGTVAFLLSDEASYITGETVCTAGGMMSRL